MSSRALFVASTGGHLAELQRLRRAVLDPRAKVAWVTFDSEQSRALLRDEPTVYFVPEVPPRGFLQLFKVILPALRILLRERPREIFSTGAAVALAFLPLAWLVGGRATYLESATRCDGPSITGRLLMLFPWVRLRTQYRSWATRRWQFGGSVFDEWHTVSAGAAGPIRRVVVTLGTQRDYPFVSLVERVQQIVPAGVEIKWQLGGGFPESRRPPGARDIVPFDELAEWVRSADAVIAHAGVGSALSLLASGRTPVLVPRSAVRGEHVDEHQSQLAVELSKRGLVVAATPSELTWDDLVASTTMSVRSAAEILAIAEPVTNEIPTQPVAAQIPTELTAA